MKVKIKNDVLHEIQDKYYESYIVLRKSNIKNEITVWNTFNTIEDLIDNFKYINTEYDADYIIKKQVIKFEDVGLFDYEYSKIRTMVDDINTKLFVQKKPNLSIFRTKNIIQTKP